MALGKMAGHVSSRHDSIDLLSNAYSVTSLYRHTEFYSLLVKSEGALTAFTVGIYAAHIDTLRSGIVIFRLRHEVGL